MKKYVLGLVLSNLFTLPAFSEPSTVMQKLSNTIQVKSKSTDNQAPQKRRAQVIAILSSKDAEVSFMQSLNSVQSNFKIKKSFSLIQPKKKQEDVNTSETPAIKQMLVISSPTLSVEELIDTIKMMPGVESVIEDQTVHACEVLPDDPKFLDLWGLDNDNDPITDINVTEAWEFSTGSDEVVIAVIDTGVDYSHSDLSQNIWTNPNEIPDNGIDDDGNGYIDDIHGIDTFNNDSDPMDDNMHGTHVAGTIGAVGDNGVGITGVNWNVKIAACKFLDAAGDGDTSDAVECINYFNALKQQGINIVALNNSWGGVGAFTPLEDAIQTANSKDILFIAAAGNGGADGIGDNNDISPFYPASYTSANVVSVAASNIDGNLATFSNYGVSSVDLVAPGVDILSTYPSSCTPDAIGDIYFFDDFESGTGKWEFLTYNTNDLTKTDIPSEHWKLDNTLYASPTNSLSDSPETTYNNDRTQIALLKNTIDLSGATLTDNTGVCLSLKVQGVTETYWDTLNIKLSKDGGQSWYAFSPVSGNIDPAWRELSFIIPKEYLVSNLHVALYRVNDSSIVYAGYNIDDVTITSGTIQHNNYAYSSGTSMATPHVSGAIALLASIDNNLSASLRKQILLDNVTYKSAYATKIATSGLLNTGTMLTHINQAPQGVNDTAQTDINTSVIIDVLANDIDVNGDTISIKAGSLTAFSQGGSAIISNNKVLYTPAETFSGIETFTYVPTDGEADGSPTTVTVTVGKTTTSSGGGGCTYNPTLKKFDAMYFVLLMLSFLYPWRRKIIK